MTDRWYISDPCYAIPNERWDEFCGKLFAHENYSSNDACMIEWEVDGEKYYVETWDSPGGDGVWNFHCGSFGVDAGLLAIIPEEVAIEAGEPYGGVWFDIEPTMRTDHNNYKVWINGELDDSWFNCDCGEETQSDRLYDCESCGTTMCYCCSGGYSNSDYDCLCEHCYDRLEEEKEEE